MLTTVEAEIEIGGKVRLLEPLEVKRKTRAIVTLLEENVSTGNTMKVLDFLRSNRLPEKARATEEEIEARVEEARESWD